MALIPALASQLLAAQTTARLPENLRVAGVVRDQTGAPVAGTRVELRIGDHTASEVTSGEGRFSFGLPPPGHGAAGSIRVAASRFAPLERPWTAKGADATALELVLVPAAITERITVTATRTAMRLSDTPADAVVLTPDDLTATAALTLDDALRQFPGFSLLRQSGSRAANPTSQGLSLRGVGASGASRAFVLADGVPLNDPFGGWVYWDRVPRESVSGVEVVRGGVSDLYGNYAMGGVVNVITRRPVDSDLFFETSYGNESTPDVSISSSLRAGGWAVGFDGEAFHTDGYLLVPRSLRGPVDNQAGSDYRTTDLTLDRIVSEKTRVFARALIFGEAAANGKVDERNDTHLRQLAV